MHRHHFSLLGFVAGLLGPGVEQRLDIAMINNEAGRIANAWAQTSVNGGRQSGAAAHKRAARKRRNVRARRSKRKAVRS